MAAGLDAGAASACSTSRTNASLRDELARIPSAAHVSHVCGTSATLGAPPQKCLKSVVN
jgi:hypothetical protein